MNDAVLNPLRLNGDPPPNAAGVPGTALAQIEAAKAVAEVQARMLMARRPEFARDPVRATDLILQDCERMSVAENAQYVFARGGTEIKGPSIDLITAIARRWGNIDSGIHEVSRQHGYSDVIAFATDMETGYTETRKFPVRHWRDTRSGGYALKDDRDITELVLNIGQRRKRGCLEALLPADVIEAAVAKCDDTMRRKGDNSPEAVAKMVQAFAELGVTKAQIEARIQRQITSIEPGQVVGLKRVYKAIRDGISTAAEMFPQHPGDAPAGADQQPATVADRAKAALRERKGKGKADADAPAPGVGEGGTDDGVQQDLAPPSAEQLRDALMKAPDRDTADMVIDRARHLPKADYDALVDLLAQRFPDA